MVIYDVFVSFCSEDTGNNFTGFLFQALHLHGIQTNKDDADLRKAESIPIEESRLFIVVFSKNYASSTLCLQELAKICNCIEASSRRVLPIFYDVDPSHVRKQSGFYDEALSQHEKRFQEDKVKMEEVQKWRKDLESVAGIIGSDIRNKNQCTEIENIVRQACGILRIEFSSHPNDELFRFSQMFSSCSSDAIKKYDVFVSFRGEDTRNNFTAFLLQALRRKGINAFKDDENLKNGEFIAPELREAIEGSRIFIVVFSKNYASSTWCLGELAHICNCIETSRRPVLLIFYDVDPLEVRKQSGCYEKAFVEHEERFIEDSKKMKEVHRWRQALTQVANFKNGWDIRNKAQYAEIEQIVKTINYELDSKSCPNDDDIGGVSQIFSSFSSHARPTYDVFVSFRGEDTRNNFTAFLFDALSQNEIHAFIDDDPHLQKGESIAPELLQAIHGSRLFVVVFSKNYASSTWCLRELAHICNCTIEASRRHVLPIFYDVNPWEVRKQSGYYGIAFAEHEKRFREDKEKMEEVQRWREALTQVANLSGWDIQNKSQHAMIKEIVQKIKYILGPKFQNLPNGNLLHILVGIKSRVEELEKCLALESVSDVRVVGISGMGGIGKTTLARALYKTIAHRYDFHCFVENVNKIYQYSGSLGVQKQLLSQCLKDKNLEICNVSVGTYLIGTMLRNKRGLIVLDDVSQVEQLDKFTGGIEALLRECLGEGSRIIIISRNEHILRTHGVHHIYQVQPLNGDNAVQLFCKHAFKCDYIMSGYEMLTHDVLSHAQGHPLAIEVMGKSLVGQNVSQWKSTLVRLSEIKSKDIMDVLRISYDDLEEEHKKIFLDIACFFNGYLEQEVKEILDFREFDPEIGLQFLVDKSLMTIREGRIKMHPLLMDLGRYVVREKSPKRPWKWTRLWHYRDLHKVMSKNMAANNLEVIVVLADDELNEIEMQVDALSKSNHLKFLSLQNVNFSGSLEYLSRELIYLIWHKYPFVCLPPSFLPDKLVELILPKSNIKILWEGKKVIFLIILFIFLFI
ncbi:hypothetical protein AAZX31_06G247800 [Glycine max]